mmetsp:Transcript_55816/g.90403  ORF Transcript_55816/g.90403 Transcript_55816/m.90403 type:complete len:99 (-) Transcript_55816:917-1213(-)
MSVCYYSFDCYHHQKRVEKVSMWPYGIHLPTHAHNHTFSCVCICNYPSCHYYPKLGTVGILPSMCAYYIHINTQTHVHMYACANIIILIVIMIENVAR